MKNNALTLPLAGLLFFLLPACGDSPIDQRQSHEPAWDGERPSLVPLWLPIRSEGSFGPLRTSIALNRDIALIAGANGHSDSPNGLDGPLKVFFGDDATYAEGNGSVAARMSISGEVLWQRFVTDGSTGCQPVALPSQTWVLCPGSGSGPIRLGDDMVSNGRVTWALVLDGEGQAQRTFQFLSEGWRVRRLVPDPTGGFFVLAQGAPGEISLGDPATTEVVDAAGQDAMVLARIGASGEVIWCRAIVLEHGGSLDLVHLDFDIARGQIAIAGLVEGSGTLSGRAIVLSKGESDAAEYLSFAGDDGLRADTWIALYGLDGGLMGSRLIRFNSDYGASVIQRKDTFLVVSIGGIYWRSIGAPELDETYVIPEDYFESQDTTVILDDQLQEAKVHNISFAEADHDGGGSHGAYGLEGGGRSAGAPLGGFLNRRFYDGEGGIRNSVAEFSIDHESGSLELSERFSVDAYAAFTTPTVFGDEGTLWAFENGWNAQTLTFADADGTETDSLPLDGLAGGLFVTF